MVTVLIKNMGIKCFCKVISFVETGRQITVSYSIIHFTAEYSLEDRLFRLPDLTVSSQTRWKIYRKKKISLAFVTRRRDKRSKG